MTNNAKSTFDSATETVRLNILISDLMELARNKHTEITDADLDRAIKLKTLESLSEISQALSGICSNLYVIAEKK